MQKKTIRTRMKRSIALILALSMLFSEAATVLADEPAYGLGGEQVVTEIVDVSEGDIDVSEEDITCDNEDFIEEQQSDPEEEITIVRTYGYRDEFYYGIEDDHRYFTNFNAELSNGVTLTSDQISYFGLYVLDEETGNYKDFTVEEGDFYPIGEYYLGVRCEYGEFYVPYKIISCEDIPEFNMENEFSVPAVEDNEDCGNECYFYMTLNEDYAYELSCPVFGCTVVILDEQYNEVYWEYIWSDSITIPSTGKYYFKVYSENETTLSVTKRPRVTKVEITKLGCTTTLYYGINNGDSLDMNGDGPMNNMTIKVTDSLGDEAEYKVGPSYMDGYYGYDFYNLELYDFDTNERVESLYDETYEKSLYPKGRYKARVYIDGVYAEFELNIVDLSEINQVVIDEDTGISDTITFSQAGIEKHDGGAVLAKDNMFRFRAKENVMYKIIADDSIWDFRIYGDYRNQTSDSTVCSFVSEANQDIVVMVKNNNPDTNVYVEEVYLPVKLELTENSSTPDFIYKEITSYTGGIYGTELVATYEDGTTEYFTRENAWDESFSVVTVNLYDAAGERAYVYDFDPGEYTLVYIIGDVSCSEPITIKSFADVTEKLNLNGQGVVVEPNTTEYIQYDEKADKNYLSYSVHDYKVYKETLETGTYSILADTTEDVRIIVYDATGEQIQYCWLYSYAGEKQFTIDTAGDYYFHVCVMDEDQTEPATIYLKTEKTIKKAEIVKQPTTTKFIRGFETPSISGMSIKVTYDDGTTITCSQRDDKWNSLVDDCDIYINGARVDWNKHNLCPVGKQKWTITLVNGIKLYSEFTVVAPTITGKLNVGGSISLKANAKQVEYRDDFGRTVISNEYDTPNIVSVNLVAGQTYHFVARSEKAAYPYIELYNPEYSRQFNLNPDSERINGFVYTAQESGTYYIVEFGRFPVELSLERYSAIESVEVVRGPYINTQISGLDYYAGYFGGNYGGYGLVLEVTLANGETEYLEYGDDLWYEYGIAVDIHDYYNKDTGVMDYNSRNRAPGEYYMKLEIPGYNGVIERGDNLDIHVISIEDALCEVGVKSFYTYDESGRCFMGTAEKLFRVEAGKTYRISCMDTDVLWIYTFDGADVTRWIATTNSYYGVPEAYYYTADKDGYILLGAGSYDCLDRTGNYVLVEEVTNAIKGISATFPTESDEYMFGSSPSILGAEITLTYEDETTFSFPGTDLSKYGVKAEIKTKNDKGEYVYPTYKVVNGYNYLDVGTYYWYLYVSGTDATYTAENHPIIVKKVASYKVNFNSNYPGGTGDKKVTQTITSNRATALKANTFKASGYEFVGWSNEQLDVLTVGVNIPEGAAVYNDKQVVTNLSDDGTTVDLYAVWRVAIYIITYHLSGGEFAEAPVKNYSYGSTVSAPEASDVKPMTGFDFAGWYMDAKYAKPATDITATTAGNIDYYAKWTPAQYTIVFNSDAEGTATKTQTVYYGIDTALTGNRFTNKGLAFMGWAYADNKETVALADKKTINVAEIISYADENKKINLYAVWKKDFNVILNPMYGTLSDEEREFGYTYGDKVILPTPTREGYKFAGWYTVEGVKVKSITNKTSGDLALMADWTPNTYTIKFDTNGGKGKTAAVKAEYDTEVNLTKCAFTRNGYTFAGWSTSKTGAVQYYDEAAVENLTAKSKGTVILYAVWNRETYTISFDSMGGTEIAAKTGHIYGSNDITLPTASEVTREGYEFKGWYKDASFKTQMKENNIKSIASDITLYAKWVAKYTVKFDGNGATSGSMKDLSCTYSTAKALTANGYKKTGFAFAGWALTPEGAAVYTNKEKISTPELNADKVLTLYAVWRNTFTINYVLNPGEYLLDDAYEYTYGTALTLPEATREGYSFAGWYTDAKLKTKASIKATTSGDLILYPKWTGLKYTVVFNMNAPAGAKTSGKMKNQSLVYGMAKVLTKNSFKATGYSFKGWATKPGGEVVFPNSAKVSDHIDELTKLYNVGDYRSTINLYAVWELDEYTVNYVMGGVVEDVTETYTVEDGGYTLISEPTRPGYTFMGFYTDKKFKKKASDLKAGTTGDKTFYAKWVAYK